MERRMVMNISISLDPFFPQERVVSFFLGARQLCLSEILVNLGGWHHFALRLIQKLAPPGKCLTVTTCSPAN